MKFLIASLNYLPFPIFHNSLLLPCPYFPHPIHWKVLSIKPTRYFKSLSPLITASTSAQASITSIWTIAKATSLVPLIPLVLPTIQSPHSSRRNLEKGESLHVTFPSPNSLTASLFTWDKIQTSFHGSSVPSGHTTNSWKG